MPGFDIGIQDACHEGNDGKYYPPSSKREYSPSHTEETARRYRYEFEVLEPLDRDSGGSTFLLLFAYKATRPTPEIDKITIHSGQDEIYRPGKNRWQPIDITFYERVTSESEDAESGSYYNQAAELIYKWWGGTNSGLPGGVIHLRDSLHGYNYKKPCQLAMLDGYGGSIWTYYLANCWPVTVSPCDISYADTEIADITVTLSYDKAIEQRRI